MKKVKIKSCPFCGKKGPFHRDTCDECQECLNPYTLYELGVRKFNNDMDNRGVDEWEKALRLFEAVEDLLGLAKCAENIGLGHQLVGKWKEAIDSFNRALEIYQHTGNILEETKILLEMGVVLNELGDWDRALEHLSRALEISKLLNYEDGISIAYLNRGVTFLRKGHWQDAIQNFKQSLEISKEINNPRIESLSLMNMGIALADEGHWEDALECYKESLEIFEQTGDRVSAFNCVGNIGGLYQRLGRWEEAMKFFSHALELSRDLGFYRCESFFRSNISVGLSFGLSDDISFSEETMEIARKLGLDKAASIQEIQQAIVQKGQKAEFKEYFERAAKKLKKIREKKYRPESLIAYGVPVLRMGQFNESLDYFNRSLQISKGQQYLELESSGIENTLMELDELNFNEKMISYFEEIIEKARAQGDLLNEAKTLGNIGIIYEKKGDLKSALERFQRCLKIFDQLDNSLGKSMTLLNIGMIHANSENWLEAIEYFKKSLDLSDTLGDKIGELGCLMNIAISFLRSKQLQSAIDMYEKAIEVAKQLGDRPAESRSYANMGIAYSKIGNSRAAISCLRRSIEINELLIEETTREELRIGLKKQFSWVFENLLDILFGALTENGRIDTEEIIDLLCEAEYFKCREISGKLEIRSSELEKKETWICPGGKEILDKINDVRAKLITLSETYTRLLHKFEERGEDSDDCKDRIDSIISERDQLKTDIEDYKEQYYQLCPDSGMVTLPYSKKRLIYQRFQKLFQQINKSGTKAAVLEFIHTNDKLGVILINSEGSPFISVKNLTERELKELTNLYLNVLDCLKEAQKTRNIVYEVDAEKSLENLSKKMYEKLIPQEIQQIFSKNQFNHIIVIPNKQLHLLPFPIIHDNDNYWGNKYAISTSLSLDLFRISLEKSKDRARGTIKNVLLIANPNFDEKTGYSKLSLPNTEIEVNTIKKMIESLEGYNLHVLSRSAATEENFVKYVNSEDLGFIHFAGHAYWEGRDPNLSFLLFNGLERLYLSEIISGIQFRGHPLVILSACESGVSKLAVGDEMFGLVRGLLLAGATSIIVSNWSVLDKPACDFMIELYRHWLEGESLSRSMFMARQSVKEKSERRLYQDLPVSMLNWGAFTLLGDPFILAVDSRNTSMFEKIIAESSADTYSEMPILRGLPKNDEGYFEEEK